jgi:hypothetical protein
VKFFKIGKSDFTFIREMRVAAASPPKKKYMRIFENKVKVICNEIVMKFYSFLLLTLHST